MPFSQILFLFRMITNNHTNITKSCRKEKKSDYTTNNLSCVLEKASVSASLKKEVIGSVTVEAVICIPLFLYAAICLIWMLELRVLQLTVRSALHEAGKNLTVTLSEVPILVPAVLEADVENIIGQERLSRSFLIDGIQCDKSYIWSGNGVMELRASYQVKLPVPGFMIPPLTYEESMRMKVWNGYGKNELGSWKVDTVVYVTDTGVVYHHNPRCTYLEPSVKRVTIDDVQSLRNDSGGKYYACGLCMGNGGTSVYVTDYGTRYHRTSTCSRIKRNVYSVPLQEVKGKGACSKCGK